MPGLSSRCARLLSSLLCFCVLWTSTAFASAPLDAATARQQIQSHGIGEIIRLTRKDGIELKGEIVSIGDESCVLQVKKQPSPATVFFAEVTKVRGPGISHGAKLGIIVGVCVLAAVGIAAIVIGHKIDTGFPKTIPI